MRIVKVEDIGKERKTMNKTSKCRWCSNEMEFVAGEEYAEDFVFWCKRCGTLKTGDYDSKYSSWCVSEYTRQKRDEKLSTKSLEEA